MLNCDNPAEVPMCRVNQECLAILVQVNDSDSLQPFGGMPGLMAALETNAETGISGDAGDLYRRHKAFGSNLYLEEQTYPVVVDGFFRLALQGFKDTTIILLFCCALLSAAIGIKRNGPVEGLRDGVIVVSVIFFVLYFGLICRIIKSRIRRRRLLKNKKHVRVVRHGKMPKISDSEVVVGDIVCLQAGNQVPADGLFIEGNFLFQLDEDFHHGDSNYYKNPSLFSGAKVREGNCQMLVLSVGKNTERNRLMRSLSSTQKIDNQESKLQISIDNTSSRLEKICLSLSLFILVVQLFQCFLYVCDDSYNPDPKGVKNAVEDLMNESAKLMKKQGTKASGLGDGTIQTLDEDKKDLLNREFLQIASNCLQVLAFAYRQIDQEEDRGEIEENDADDIEETLKPLEHGLIFLALVSLKNPYAPELRQAIQDCRASGVAFKLVVDTDITTARIMALYSRILRPEEDIEGAIIEASDFRKNDKEERLKTIKNIHVIANTSPTDRLQFVQCLKQKNKVVALAGSCIRDCPSLIEADVGIFMGNLSGAEDADIVFLNQNVSPIFTIIKLGRCIHESVKKFTQLQLTLNITAFTVNFVFVIARRDVQLLPFQVLWINVIMDVSWRPCFGYKNSKTARRIRCSGCR
ncbi:calcium-transporting ATPase 12, plasma membrane-type-like [Olea europaea subsp. europaea]|uniref:Calcium-transporting ATPase 12, plasma membrane-type-like n=1 Tax=Olea europaea subsp. europaea TaxID=158383 RepID=A0A8S0QE63_OLEEU|nr:calcium-transporting ATPase 12, plasma membrane-type-like [Olea europaea subsp. europaea]